MAMRMLKINKFVITRRGLRVLLTAIAGAFACMLVGRGANVEAATLTGVASQIGAGIDAPATSLAQFRNRNRGWRRQRFRQRRQRMRQQRHGRQHDQRPGKNAGQKPDKKHQQTDNRPGKTPDKNNQQQAGHHPDRNPDRDKPNKNHSICIGGRVIAKRCLCRQVDVRNALRANIFICGRPGRRPVLPQVAAIAPSAVFAIEPDNSNTPAPNPAPQQAQTATLLPDSAPDEVLVSLAPTAPETVEEQVAQSYGIQLIGRWSLDLLDTRLVLYRIPDGRAVAAVVATLSADQRINAPQPNYYYREEAGSSSNAEPQETATLQYAFVKLELDAAHSIAEGYGVTVAVIDSEIDTTHPDLTGTVMEKFDATEKDVQSATDHGTAIAGIIGARGVLQGVAPEGEILGVNVFEPVGASQTMAATTASLLRGMDWAIGKGARVINMSLTGPRDALLNRGVEAAVRDGAIVVAAAGNNGPDAPPVYPAAYPEVIAVTATDFGDDLYKGANHGSYIEIAAPGVDVLVPALEHAHLLKSGTSFAAAHISGIIALMIERDPTLILDDIRRTLADGALDLGPAGRDDSFGAGRANAHSTLRILQTVPFPPAKRPSSDYYLSHGGDKAGGATIVHRTKADTD